MTDIPSEIEPNRPKRPKTGGRQKGSANKATKDIKSLAAPYGPEAVAVLAKIMHEGETHAVRVAAANALLDRGFGKASQPIEHSGSVDVAMTLDRIIAQRREREMSMRALGTVSPPDTDIRLN